VLAASPWHGKIVFMEFIQKYRLWIAGIIVVVAGIAILMLGYQHFKPLPETTEFKGRYFSFTYPRIYNAQEYAPGVVSIGTKNDAGLDPLVEVTRYGSDPDSALPKSFDTFMKLQAGVLCGADGPIESIACTEIGVTPYTSPTGLSGQMLNLTLIKKNLKTGTTTNETYGPFYVFNTTNPATTDTPLRYSGIFIHPSLAAFLSGTTSPAIMQGVLSTFTLASGTTSNIK
jgi:hypothetical protein